MADELDELSDDGDLAARLTGAQKAAIFLLQMGKERSAKVLQTLKES